MDTTRKPIAEALGTFFLCFAGIAAILSTQNPIASGAGLVGIALAHGLALSIAVNAFGGISGGHQNPALTLGFLSTGRIAAALAILYILAQLVGATVAAKLGIPLPGGDWVTTNVLLLAEFITTFLLITAVFGTAVDPRGQAVKIGGFGIGLTVAIDILACGPVTGASMNPARSFGPAFVLGDFNLHWCYWVAPVAALLYHHVLLEKDSDG